MSTKLYLFLKQMLTKHFCSTLCCCGTSRSPHSIPLGGAALAWFNAEETTAQRVLFPFCPSKGRSAAMRLLLQSQSRVCRS